MPKVSVIIPNYNHARYLRQRIESVVGQTYQDFEVILLDDCSTDESRSIIDEYARDPRVRIEFNQKNSGNTFKQWNKGVKLARGEYVWVAESDACPLNSGPERSTNAKSAFGLAECASAGLLHRTDVLATAAAAFRHKIKATA
jgi:cellulose synthase/poly-beta-1,6-N-acetylglucosamine synthase-like glycosyltransferase